MIENVTSSLRSADKAPRHESHCGHIVPAPMPALGAGTSGLAVNCPWKRITVLAVSALRHALRI
jgi:hypothetical protein